MAQVRVALVHDWLTGMRGGEHCLRAFLALYPDADIVTLLNIPGATSPEINRRVSQTSWLNRLPGVQKYYRALLPVFPAATAQLSLKGYDLVISISHAAAKNVHVPSGTPHVCYCLSPMRYIWDLSAEYFGRGNLIMTPLLRALRRWDRKGAQGVTNFAAISRFVAARVRCFYGRSASVIYPPVDLSWIKIADGGVGDAFLYAGALVPYKRCDLVIEVCNHLKLPLWVAGSGPEEKRLRSLAGPTVHFFGALKDAELAQLYRHCRALIFPGKEDFGMIPIEAMAAGRPVIAPCEGATRETVVGLKPWQHATESGLDAAHSSGVFIRSTERPAEGLSEALAVFLRHEHQFDREWIAAQARRFGVDRFFAEWRAFANRIGVYSGVPEPGAAYASRGGEVGMGSGGARLARVGAEVR